MLELSLPPQSASPSTLEQLPVYFYQGGRTRDFHFITERIQFDCFHRSVHSQYAQYNKTRLMF